MIYENKKLYSDDRRFYTIKAEGRDAAHETIWADCALTGLEDNTMGKIGYRSVYRPGNADYSKSAASPELLGEMSQFQQEASAWFAAKNHVPVKPAVPTPAKQKPVNPATTYVGQASMDAEDSIF